MGYKVSKLALWDTQIRHIKKIGIYQMKIQ